MAAYLIVRAEVPETSREAFDRWYEVEHLPDAMVAFQCQHAERGWSDLAPGVHVALYTFPSLERAREVVNGDAIKALIAEFDRAWQGRVKCTREVVGISQRLNKAHG